MDHSKVADAGAVGTWLAFFLAHIAEINNVLQFFLLIAGLVSAVFAIRYHAKNTPK